MQGECYPNLPAVCLIFAPNKLAKPRLSPNWWCAACLIGWIDTRPLEAAGYRKALDFTDFPVAGVTLYFTSRIYY
jgi:hypothetical protein